jgi:hypothetical protein
MAADRRHPRNGVCQRWQVGVSRVNSFSHGGHARHGRNKKTLGGKALNKIRSDEASKSQSDRRDEKMDGLDEEIKRMRAQRLRLERHQRKRD